MLVPQCRTGEFQTDVMINVLPYVLHGLSVRNTGAAVDCPTGALVKRRQGSREIGCHTVAVDLHSHCDSIHESLLFDAVDKLVHDSAATPTVAALKQTISIKLRYLILLSINPIRNTQIATNNAVAPNGKHQDIVPLPASP